MIAECRGLAWIYLLSEQCIYAQRFNPMSAVAQYQVQQHTAVAGFVMADDHIPARLERKRQRRKFLRHLFQEGTGSIRRRIWIRERSLGNSWAAQW